MNCKWICSFLLFCSSLFFVSCRAMPGPDKSLAGMVLGAAWGAGAGAVVGHQTGNMGPGALVGSGFGAASGLMSGIGLDVAEGVELRRQRELDGLKIQVAANRRSLESIQDTLDARTRRLSMGRTTSRVFFDKDLASLRAGAVAQLQRLAQEIKANPYVGTVEIHGHSDDTGATEKNYRLSEARARTVASFLGHQGISMDAVRVLSHGATRPLATNETEAGRQLNRRVELVLRK